MFRSNASVNAQIFHKELLKLGILICIAFTITHAFPLTQTFDSPVTLCSISHYARGVHQLKQSNFILS